VIRVTRLSDSCMRVRWAPDGRLDGRPALFARGGAAEELLHPVLRDGVAVHETSMLRVTVHVAVDLFTPPRVHVAFAAGGMEGAWWFGDDDPGNLGGPVANLDTVGSYNLPPLPPSLLSRRGAAILDESHGPVIDESGFAAVRDEHHRALDLYVFAYGRDFRRALRDYVLVAGPPPLPPRAILGLWYSRFWRHTDGELLEVADRFAAEGMPLDTLVVDVDWHLHGWEGYDWDPACFPDPAAFLEALRARRILSSFNVHPRVPLRPADSHHGECRRRLARPVGEDEGIVFNHALRDEATVAYEVLRRPIETLGCDIWWIDGAHAPLDGGDEQLLTNHAFLHFAERSASRRSVVLARYGGRGSHRGCIGFSADTHSHWAVLRYQVMLTARSANEAYGLWSHDVGGFFGRRLDPELLVRWMQAASLWPVLRLHSAHGDRLPWDYGDAALAACRSAVQLRLRLLPFLYDLQWEAHTTGLSMYRPMYVDWPECEAAYGADDQAMVGGALLHAPVCARGREPDGAALRTVWLPPGEWHDLRSGARLPGDRSMAVRAGLDESPLFGRAGGIVVTQPPGLRGIDAVPEPLGITVFHGADGSHLHVEDDGVSRAFEQGAVSRIPIRYQDECGEVVVGPLAGDGPSPPRRLLLVQLAGVDGAEEVVVEGGSIVERDATAWAPRGVGVLVRTDDLRTAPLRVRFLGACDGAVDQTSVRHLAMLTGVPIPGDDDSAAAPPDGVHDLGAPGWRAITLPPPADPLDDPTARLDLMPWGGRDVPRTFAYLAARLDSSAAQDVLVHLPMTVVLAHLRVWVDGVQIAGETRPLLDHADEHVFPVHLDAGMHDVLVRMVHPQYCNFFALRVTAPDGISAARLRVCPLQPGV
jgi:hypothetical protein